MENKVPIISQTISIVLRISQGKRYFFKEKSQTLTLPLQIKYMYSVCVVYKSKYVCFIFKYNRIKINKIYGKCRHYYVYTMIESRNSQNCMKNKIPYKYNVFNVYFKLETEKSLHYVYLFVTGKNSLHTFKFTKKYIGSLPATLFQVVIGQFRYKQIRYKRTPLYVVSSSS